MSDPSAEGAPLKAHGDPADALPDAEEQSVGEEEASAGGGGSEGSTDFGSPAGPPPDVAAGAADPGIIEDPGATEGPRGYAT